MLLRHGRVQRHKHLHRLADVTVVCVQHHHERVLVEHREHYAELLDFALLFLGCRPGLGLGQAEPWQPRCHDSH